jgi:hypothetical protein
LHLTGPLDCWGWRHIVHQGKALLDGLVHVVAELEVSVQVLRIRGEALPKNTWQTSRDSEFMLCVRGAYVYLSVRACVYMRVSVIV